MLPAGLQLFTRDQKIRKNRPLKKRETHLAISLRFAPAASRCRQFNSCASRQFEWVKLPRHGQGLLQRANDAMAFAASRRADRSLGRRSAQRQSNGDLVRRGRAPERDRLRRVARRGSLFGIDENRTTCDWLVRPFVSPKYLGNIYVIHRLCSWSLRVDDCIFCGPRTCSLWDSSRRTSHYALK